MSKDIIIETEAKIGERVKDIVAAIAGRNHVAFDAPMGAGKTTLIGVICREMGVEDDVNSPTFSIINEYRAGDGRSIYHFDFYRIENESQGFELGLEDYFESGSLCLMEWPENVESLLPDDTLYIRIRVGADESRIVTITE